MPIPLSPRVKFANNPLAQVICQLRFPRMLEIEQELPIDFQLAIRSKFPELRIQHQVSFEIASDGSQPIQRAQPSYDFFDVDGIRHISLNSTFIALTYDQYDNWQEFLADVEFATRHLLTIYEVPYFSRCGLRYIDIIDRASLDLLGTPWNDLVRPDLIGLIGSDAFDVGELEEYSCIGVGKAKYGKLRLATGLARKSDGSDTVGLSIDADFFTEEKFRANINECIDLLGKYNQEAGNLFRWAITEHLKGALEPVEK